MSYSEFSIRFMGYSCHTISDWSRSSIFRWKEIGNKSACHRRMSFDQTPLLNVNVSTEAADRTLWLKAFVFFWRKRQQNENNGTSILSEKKTSTQLSIFNEDKNEISNRTWPVKWVCPYACNDTHSATHAIQWIWEYDGPKRKPKKNLFESIDRRTSALNSHFLHVLSW